MHSRLAATKQEREHRHGGELDCLHDRALLPPLHLDELLGLPVDHVGIGGGLHLHLVVASVEPAHAPRRALRVQKQLLRLAEERLGGVDLLLEDGDRLHGHAKRHTASRGIGENRAQQAAQDLHRRGHGRVCFEDGFLGVLGDQHAQPLDEGHGLGAAAGCEGEDDLLGRGATRAAETAVILKQLHGRRGVVDGLRYEPLKAHVHLALHVEVLTGLAGGDAREVALGDGHASDRHATRAAHL
mmetsp:Transcript_8447/g.34326  ORF Transcript_8447/g.34326 Transcript_8447/m.34326 type:complete len:242 (-) Transcript_8447:546-1271(-)